MTMLRWIIVGEQAKAWKESIDDSMVDDGIKFDCVGTFEDEEAFSKTDLNDLVPFDAGLVLSDLPSHYNHCLHLLNHNKHVLCQKPFCFTQDELKELFVASEKNQKMMAQICLNRFHPEIAKYGKVLMKQKRFELTHKIYEAEDRLPLNLTYEVALDDIDTFLFFFFNIPVKLNFGTVNKLEEQVHEILYEDKKINLLGTRGQMKQQIMFFEEGVSAGFTFIDGPEFLRIELEMMKMIEELEFKERAKKPLDPFYLEVELDFTTKEINEKAN
jgi:hypothetical protein